MPAIAGGKSYVTGSFRGSANALSGNWHWQGDARVRRLELAAWGAGDALGVISGPLKISGDHNGFAAVGQLDPAGLKSGPLAVDFAGNYAAHLLSIAPTGTISLAFADNASNGIEPPFSWTYNRKKRMPGSTGFYNLDLLTGQPR